MHLKEELTDLHDSYVEAVNIAVSHDDLDDVRRLAAEYDDAAISLIAEREGVTHLLPRRSTPGAEAVMRRFVTRFRTQRAA